MGIAERKIKHATTATKTVVICLDGAGAMERDALITQVVSAAVGGDQRVSRDPAKKAKAELAALEERLADSLLELEIKALSPAKWSQMKRQAPPSKATTDQHMGFNVEKAVQEALFRSAWAVEGDERERLTRDEWNTLFNGDGDDAAGAMSGGDWDRLVSAVFALNQSSRSEEIARGKVRSSQTGS